MAELMNIDLMPVLVTLIAFQIGLWIQKKVPSPLCNPILIAVILVGGFLAVSGMDVQHYQTGTAAYSWLLTPATVCLAIPMYEQMQLLRRNLPAILLGVVVGTAVCLVMILLLCAAFGFDGELTVSILPKSVTTAIGVPLSQLNGGIGSVSTAVIIITGILGSVFGPILCKVLRITDETARGVAFGTASHVIGTSKANEMGSLTGAVSSLSLVVAGILTAVLFPMLVTLI